MVDNYIRSGDFCRITSDDFKEAGLEKGSTVFVAGHKALPISEEDPYTQRVIFLCHLSSEDGTIDLTRGFFTIDPTSLEKVTEEEQSEMLNGLQDQIDQSHLEQVEPASDAIN